MIFHQVNKRQLFKYLSTGYYFRLYFSIILSIKLSDNLNPLFTNRRMVPVTSEINPFLLASNIIPIVPIISILND